MRSLFGFFGVTEVTFHTAGGTTALNHGQNRDAFLAPQLDSCAVARPTELKQKIDETTIDRWGASALGLL